MFLIPFIVVSAIIFAIGVYGALTRRNAIAILMSLELMLNAANINLVAFNKFLNLENNLGIIFPLFVITIAAAEAAIGLALILSMYRQFKSVYIEKINLMKW
ncbi:MAG: NADH-quinone oxidoreductase subunit NuoK [Candidatus Firestonebacteria bacterium]